jgi:hypothetical protein
MATVESSLLRPNHIVWPIRGRVASDKVIRRVRWLCDVHSDDDGAEVAYRKGANDERHWNEGPGWSCTGGLLGRALQGQEDHPAHSKTPKEPGPSCGYPSLRFAKPQFRLFLVPIFATASSGAEGTTVERGEGIGEESGERVIEWQREKGVPTERFYSENTHRKSTSIVITEGRDSMHFTSLHCS